MGWFRGCGLLQAGVALLLLAAPGLAETRQALVIAERAEGQEIGQPARDALEVSRALLAAGFDVRRLESPLALPDAPAEPPDVMLIYLSADLAMADAGMMALLSSGEIGLAPLAARYPAGQAVILVVENCPLDGATGAVETPLGPDVPPNGLISHAETCAGQARLTEGLMAALRQPAADLATSLTDAGLPVRTGDGWTGFQPVAPRAPVADSGGTLILDQPLRPVNPTVTSPRPGGMLAAAGRVGGGVQILPAAAPAAPLGGDRAARPTESGLPEPSIMVGIRPRDDAPQDDLLGTALGTSYEERRRIRDEDPDLFASLLDSGAFDPPSDQMASAIQTELQRMNCYAGGIDGLWGNGSRAAVARYFQQVGGNPVSQQAEVALFRQIALRDDARCPDPQPVRQATPQPVTTRQPATSTRQAPAAPARQQPRVQPAAPAPPPASTQQPALNPNLLGTGIFR